MTVERRAGSCSIEQPDHWWYRARDELLRTVFAGELGPAPRGLRPGEGVCASALGLPFADATFDAVTAFDVVEHCEPEEQAVGELERVLRPGGRLYAFTLVFPFFVAERLKQRVAPVRDGGLPTVPAVVERLLLRLTARDARLLRIRDLPFGSSVFLAAQKPEVARP